MNKGFTFLELSEGRKYPMMFNLNVMEDIQEEYGTMDRWGKMIQPEDGGEPSIRALKFTFLKMMNEGIDYMNELKGEKKPLLTDREVGRIITEVGLEKAGKQISKIVTNSTKSDDDEKNL